MADPKPRRGGLTAPTGRAADALEELMREERQTAEPPPQVTEDDSKKASELDTYKASNIANAQDSNLALPEAPAGERLTRKPATNSRTRPKRDAAPPVSVPSNGSSNLSSRQPTDIASYRASTLASIEAMKDTPLSQLNIRIPAGINDWLDERAHRYRKKGATKQGLVTRALEEMILRLETEGDNA